MLEEYIKIIKPYIIDLFKNDSSGHDISHLTRTMNIAINLCDKEGGNKIVVGIAAYMHDIHRIMQNEKGSFVNPKDTIPKVKEILAHTDLSSDLVDEICYCIEFHEVYNWNGKNVENKNALILQDADNLDAIGAIGVGRSFSYGGAHGLKLYDDNIPINNDNYFEEDGDDPSTIHHFYHKLFKLKDNMNTRTAKEIASRRVEYMQEFVQEFLLEWNGNK